MGVFTYRLDLLLCLFLFLHKGISVYSQGDNLAPHFNVPAQNETAVAGRTAILTCTIQSLGDHKVAWMDPKLKLLTIADQRIIQDTRISVERPFTQNWNLHIRQVRLNDSGEYQCQINTKPVKSTKVLLIVQEPPAIIRTSGSQTVREWETVSLWCTVTGVPFPTVTWYRKNKHEHQKATEVVGADGEGLKIHNISRYCQDEYECVADNGIETMAKAKMAVTVEFAPEVSLFTTKLSQSQGKETILDCSISASPHAYRYKGMDIQQSAKYGISVYNDDRYTKTLSLRIGSLTEEDFGRYKCVAENKHGSDEDSILLHELKELRQEVVTTTTTTTTRSPLKPVNSNEYFERDKHVYPTRYWNRMTPDHNKDNVAETAQASRTSSAHAHNAYTLLCTVSLLSVVLLR